jgi:phospholipase C
MRLTPGQAVTCDQDHTYRNEQRAYDGGAMDKFVEFVSRDACKPGHFASSGLTMDYYDGNTVTALWNYAQKYAMSDSSYSTTFGPSSPGAINLVSGQTHGVREYTAASDPAHPTPVLPTSSDYTVRFPDANGVGTMINDPDPVYDDCSNASHTTRNTLAGMQASNRNVGDLLGAKGVSWGWFQGGFRPTTPYDPTTGTPAACLATHTNAAGLSSTDYNPHHEPFQYYASTANPHHLAPASVAEIGHDGRANHQYDLADFDQVVGTDRLPAVSFLKAANYQDGHAEYSDPVDEQRFVIREVNAIEQSPNWKDTAVILAYDDSDGWYDHVAARLTNASDGTDDAAWCIDAAAAGVPVEGGYLDRCGPGPRQPLLVVSPYARTNFVDHTQTDQASILRFIEDNWSTGLIGDHSADARAGSLEHLFHFPNAKAPKVLLDPTDGTIASVESVHGSSHD